MTPVWIITLADTSSTQFVDLGRFSTMTPPLRNASLGSLYSYFSKKYEFESFEAAVDFAGTYPDAPQWTKVPIINNDSRLLVKQGDDVISPSVIKMIVSLLENFSENDPFPDPHERLPGLHMAINLIDSAADEIIRIVNQRSSSSLR